MSKYRVTQARSVLNSSEDYAGCFLIKNGLGCVKRTLKVHLVFFASLAIRAVHLKLITDLTSDSFLNALKRFVSSRWYEHNVYSIQILQIL